jgi:hypothetical protein
MISWARSLVRATNASRSRTIQRAARSSSGSSSRIRCSIDRNCSLSTSTLADSGIDFASSRWAIITSIMSCSSPTLDRLTGGRIRSRQLLLQCGGDRGGHQVVHATAQPGHLADEGGGDETPRGLVGMNTVSTPLMLAFIWAICSS